MKRWNVKFADHEMKLYYPDYETAKERNPKAINITENTDFDYFNYVKKIKEKSIETLYDYIGRKVDKILHNGGYILVRFYMEIEDDKEFYYDGCDYQRHDENKFVVPITWVCSSPKEFYELFVEEDNHIELPVEIISLRELKKLKPVRFYNKNNKAYYQDCNGYFYYVNKYDLPNKKSKEEYERFKDNKNAVYAKINKCDYRGDMKWFDSESDLIKEFQEIVNNTPTSYSRPFYEIVKHDYTEVRPEDRKVIFRLPYFRLDKELKYERRECRNENSAIHWVTRQWCEMMKGHRQFGDALDNADWVEDMIKRWCEYREKIKEGVA